MPRPSILLKRSLIFLHRWLGVALSVLFMLWFCSGIVMMYWSFPEVSARDRLQRAVVLHPAQIKLTPAEAWAKLGRDDTPAQVRVGSFDGRPAYRFSGESGGRRRGRGGRGSEVMVYADDGALRKRVDDAMVDRVAVSWAGQPLSSAKKESVVDVDQWTVAGQLRNLRPLYKYSFSDGQQVYVSGRDAEVVQYTTRESRFWAYLGAIPHWMYFTEVRKNQPQWFQFVVWSSGIGAIAALLGIIVALWMLSPRKKYRYNGAPTSIPYREWKRWHTIMGLAFGLVTLTWAFSGMLSMGPFDFVERLAGNRPSERTRPLDVAGALRGSRRFELSAYKSAADAVEELGSSFQPKELELSMFASEPVYVATNGAGETRIVPVDGVPTAEFDRNDMIRLITDAAGTKLAELRSMDEYDAYYLDRTGKRPLPVLCLRLNDESHSRYYIDPKTARVVGTYSSRNWINRWLYHGLHSLDFPWLYKYRPLWDIVVISLMLGGTAVCVTSLVLAWGVVKAKAVAIL